MRKVGPGSGRLPVPGFDRINCQRAKPPLSFRLQDGLGRGAGPTFTSVTSVDCRPSAYRVALGVGWAAAYRRRCRPSSRTARTGVGDGEGSLRAPAFFPRLLPSAVEQL